MDIKVQIPIDEVTSKGRYTDAIYILKTEFDSMTTEQINALVQARVDAWVQFRIEQESVEPAQPTQEELLAAQAALEAELARIQEALNGGA